MDGFGAFWHLMGFFAPAAGVGLLSAAATKLLWRRELESVRWWRLSLWAAGAGSGVLVGGLLVFGRDGAMATYAAMIVGSAVALWWAGFGRRGR